MNGLVVANLLCAFVQLVGWYVFRELDMYTMSIWCAVWITYSLVLAVVYWRRP